MRRLVPDVARYSRKRQIFLTIFILVIAGAGFLIWDYNQKNKLDRNADAAITTEQTLNSDQVYANEKIKQKDYDQAINACLAVATDKYNASDYGGAKSSLQFCLKQIPDVKVPWAAYSIMAAIAVKLKDKQLEKSSLTIAITKASATGSDASPEKIVAMKQQLTGLK